jgi:hypothetical protein
MRLLFANPADVAYADQAAAGLAGTFVEVRRFIPLGWMYLIPAEHAGDATDAAELRQIAEQVIEVRLPTPP